MAKKTKIKVKSRGPKRVVREKSGLKKRRTKKKGVESTGRVVAISGVNGFIGRSLLERLNLDPNIKKIIAIDIKNPPLASTNVKYYKIDFTEPIADAKIAEVLEEEGCDTFVHLAFFMSPTKRGSYAHELESIGTMYVLNACAGVSSIKKVIVGSTAMVYGANPKNPNYLSEDHPMRGNMGYKFVREKIEVERQLKKFRKKYPSVCVTVLRPCTILGPNIRNFVTRFFSRLHVVTLLGYDPLVQFVHEDDVIDAFQLAVNGDHPGIFNIVGKGVLPLSTVVRLMGKINIRTPAFMAYPMADAAWSAGLEDAPGPHLDYVRYLWVADGEKASKEMGFEPKYSTKDTI